MVKAIALRTDEYFKRGETYVGTLHPTKANTVQFDLNGELVVVALDDTDFNFIIENNPTYPQPNHEDFICEAKCLHSEESVAGYYVVCRKHHYILPIYQMGYGFDDRWSKWEEVDPSTLRKYYVENEN